MDSNIYSIATKIHASSKYRGLYFKTIERVVEDSLKRYSDPKLAEAKARLQLHQIWGAYYKTKAKFPKLLKNFEKDLQESKAFKESILPLLKIHASVDERLNEYETIYNFILENVGKVESISDYGCGFNPILFMSYWNSYPINYLACDIDSEELDFIVKIYKIAKKYGYVDNLDLKTQASDLYVDNLFKSQIIFLFKIVPVLLQQSPERFAEVLGSLDCEFLVVTFPIESLSGKNKGMEKFYSELFEKYVDKLSKHKKISIKKQIFSNELLYIIKYNIAN